MSPKHAFFSSNWLFSWKNKILNVSEELEQNFECFTRIGRVFSTYRKILKINQKKATPVRSGYSDFAENWKVPKTCFFFFKLIVFVKEQNFECFRKIGRVFSTFRKILKITQKMATPVRSGYSDFGPNWKVPQKCLFFLQTDCFHERTKFWMFQKNWKGIFNISKNTHNQPKNGRTGKVRIQRFCRKLKSPKNMRFFLLTEFECKNKIWNVSEELEQNFDCFTRIGRVFSTYKKILKINQKKATPVRSGYSDFAENWKVPKTCFFFLQTDCFHERTKFWMFQKNWKGIFNISKNTQNQLKKGHAGKVGIQRFCRKLKSPKNMRFFLQTQFECKNKILNVSQELEVYFQHFKNSQNQPKKGHAGKVLTQRFCRKLKSPKNLLILLQTDCFHERTKFWMFQKNWKGIFNISKNTQNQPKNGHAGKVRIQRFWSKLKWPQNMPFFSSNWLFSWENKFWMFQKNWNKILNVSRELEGYFQHIKKDSKSTKKLPCR